MAKKYGPGEWETIGGTIEDNETPEECIKREIAEELKTTVKTCLYFKDYFMENGYIAVFIVTLESELSFAKDDFAEIKWVSKDEIEEMTFVLDCRQRLLDYFNLK
jgi:8-oxo-dGTP diphosphatase